MQNKIGEVMMKNMSKRNRKRLDKTKEEEEKCWDLHNKVSRLNLTEPSMLTPKGIKFLKIAKNGFKDLDKLKTMDLPLKMCELSLSHVESDEEINEAEITLILALWKGFQIDPDRNITEGSKIPRFK